MMALTQNSGIRDSGFVMAQVRGATSPKRPLGAAPRVRKRGEQTRLSARASRASRGFPSLTLRAHRLPEVAGTGAVPGGRNQSPGFTMAEVMVTIVIIGIAAAIVVPTIGDTTDTQVVAAARSIAADLQYAQNLAITTQSNVYVVFNNAQMSYSLSNNANASPPLISPITSTSYTVTFGSGNGFSGLNSMTAHFGGNATMYFDLLGAPHADGTVQVVAGPHVYVVTVAPATGKITVSDAGV